MGKYPEEAPNKGDHTMNATFELDIQKEKYEYTSLMVTGRMGDLASNTVEIYMKMVVNRIPSRTLRFYECVKPDDTVIRDTKGVNMIDAANGHFSYTFPAEVFSVPGQIKRLSRLKRENISCHNARFLGPNLM